MNKKVKKMSVKEFRENGYLQEMNRLFLHPLGLAMEVTVDDDGNESFSGVWDYRDDSEGIYYDLKNSPADRVSRFSANEEKVRLELEKHMNTREKLIGGIIERIPNLNSENGHMKESENNS